MDLLRNCLVKICNSVNIYMNNLDPRQDSWVILSSIVSQNGTTNKDAVGKIVMTVYNITRESFASSYSPATMAPPSANAALGLTIVPPPIYLDIHLMFMANFTDHAYPDGLAALSSLIGFFQQTPVINQQNTPGLSPEIDQLTLDLENLSPVDVNYVMGMLGTRYLPSAFYKLRMIPFASTAMQARTYAVSGSGMGGIGA